MRIHLFVRQIKFLSHNFRFRCISQNTSTTGEWKKIKAMDQMPPSRNDPIVTNLDTPEFKSLFTPELDVIKALFKKNDYELRVAGGAVRDILMGINPKDIDLATTATPDQMISMFTDEQIRMLNTNGERHGTVTARINDKDNFEITTLRVDVVTDGRRADVEFTKDWKLDANRRDLTINSMFLDFDGNVYDHFFGYEDLKKKRVAFVGDAATRICEDYLRILRYFRFYGRIAEGPDNHEEDTLQAIRDNVMGLERVSGERIWSEWEKIMAGNYGMELMNKMIECNLTKYIGLPENPDVENFKKVCLRASSKCITLHPVTMIVALLKENEEVMNMFQRLRWSKYNRDLACFIVTSRDDNLNEAPYPLYPYQHLLLTSSKPKVTREYVCELMNYKGEAELAKEFNEWNPPKFPLNGLHLKPLVPHAKLIAPALTSLKGIWLQDNCKTTCEELLQHVPDLVASLSEKYKPLLEKLASKNK